MNKSFKVIRNRLGQTVVASELAKGLRKGLVSSLVAFASVFSVSNSANATQEVVKDRVVVPNSKQKVAEQATMNAVEAKKIRRKLLR